MEQTIIWNPMGEMLNTFESSQEAEEWIDECDMQILSRTYSKGDENIVVMEMM
jgi:hypothetical protein